ncbi:unnamed protein product [Effrenium voratum]|nr:unnamed protein product [Effrenium voratum]
MKGLRGARGGGIFGLTGLDSKSPRSRSKGRPLVSAARQSRLRQLEDAVRGEWSAVLPDQPEGPQAAQEARGQPLDESDEESEVNALDWRRDPNKSEQMTMSMSRDFSARMRWQVAFAKVREMTNVSRKRQHRVALASKVKEYLMFHHSRGACSRMSRHIENYDRSNLAGTEVVESLADAVPEADRWVKNFEDMRNALEPVVQSDQARKYDMNELERMMRMNQQENEWLEAQQKKTEEMLTAHKRLVGKTASSLAESVRKVKEVLSALAAEIAEGLQRHAALNLEHEAFEAEMFELSRRQKTMLTQIEDFEARKKECKDRYSFELEKLKAEFSKLRRAVDSGKLQVVKDKDRCREIMWEVQDQVSVQMKDKFEVMSSVHIQRIQRFWNVQQRHRIMRQASAEKEIRDLRRKLEERRRYLQVAKARQVVAQSRAEATEVQLLLLELRLRAQELEGGCPAERRTFRKMWSSGDLTMTPPTGLLALLAEELQIHRGWLTDRGQELALDARSFLVQGKLVLATPMSLLTFVWQMLIDANDTSREKLSRVFREELQRSREEVQSMVEDVQEVSLQLFDAREVQKAVEGALGSLEATRLKQQSLQKSWDHISEQISGWVRDELSEKLEDLDQGLSFAETSTRWLREIETHRVSVCDVSGQDAAWLAELSERLGKRCGELRAGQALLQASKGQQAAQAVGGLLLGMSEVLDEDLIQGGERLCQRLQRDMVKRGHLHGEITAMYRRLSRQEQDQAQGTSAMFEGVGSLNFLLEDTELESTQEQVSPGELLSILHSTAARVFKRRNSKVFDWALMGLDDLDKTTSEELLKEQARAEARRRDSVQVSELVAGLGLGAEWTPPSDLFASMEELSVAMHLAQKAVNDYTPEAPARSWVAQSSHEATEGGPSEDGRPTVPEVPPAASPESLGELSNSRPATGISRASRSEAQLRDNGGTSDEQTEALAVENERPASQVDSRHVPPFSSDLRAQDHAPTHPTPEASRGLPEGGLELHSEEPNKVPAAVHVEPEVQVANALHRLAYGKEEAIPAQDFAMNNIWAPGSPAADALHLEDVPDRTRDGFPDNSEDGQERPSDRSKVLEGAQGHASTSDTLPAEQATPVVPSSAFGPSKAPKLEAPGSLEAGAEARHQGLEMDDSNRPTSTGQPDSTGRPASIGRPESAGEPASAGRLDSAGRPSTGQPGLIGQPDSTGQPASGRPSTGQPDSLGRPESTGQPASAGRLDSAGRPSTGQPDSIGVNDATGQPFSTGQLDSTGRPSTGQPVSTAQPASTGQPASAGQLDSAGRPSTGQPDSIGVNDATGQPFSTGQLDSTGRPSIGQPASTGEPASTGQPSSAGRLDSAGRPSTGHPDSIGLPDSIGQPASTGQLDSAGQPSTGQPDSLGRPEAGRPASFGQPASTEQLPAWGSTSRHSTPASRDVPAAQRILDDGRLHLDAGEELPKVASKRDLDAEPSEDAAGDTEGLASWVAAAVSSRLTGQQEGTTSEEVHHESALRGIRANLGLGSNAASPRRKSATASRRKPKALTRLGTGADSASDTPTASDRNFLIERMKTGDVSDDGEKAKERSSPRAGDSTRKEGVDVEGPGSWESPDSQDPSPRHLQKEEILSEGEESESEEVAEPSAEAEAKVKDTKEVSHVEEADLPGRSESDLPARSESDLPARSESDLPARSESDLPARSESDQAHLWRGLDDYTAMAVAEMAGDSRAVAAHARRLLDGVILEEEQPPEEPEPEVPQPDLEEPQPRPPSNPPEKPRRERHQAQRTSGEVELPSPRNEGARRAFGGRVHSGIHRLPRQETHHPEDGIALGEVPAKAAPAKAPFAPALKKAPLVASPRPQKEDPESISLAGTSPKAPERRIRARDLPVPGRKSEPQEQRNKAQEKALDSNSLAVGNVTRNRNETEEALKDLAPQSWMDSWIEKASQGNVSGPESSWMHFGEGPTTETRASVAFVAIVADGSVGDGPQGMRGSKTRSAKRPEKASAKPKTAPGARSVSASKEMSEQLSEVPEHEPEVDQLAEEPSRQNHEETEERREDEASERRSVLSEDPEERPHVEPDPDEGTVVVQKTSRTALGKVYKRADSKRLLLTSRSFTSSHLADARESAPAEPETEAEAETEKSEAAKKWKLGGLAVQALVRFRMRSPSPELAKEASGHAAFKGPNARAQAVQAEADAAEAEAKARAAEAVKAAAAEAAQRAAEAAAVLAQKAAAKAAAAKRDAPVSRTLLPPEGQIVGPVQDTGPALVRVSSPRIPKPPSASSAVSVRKDGPGDSTAAQSLKTGASVMLTAATIQAVRCLEQPELAHFGKSEQRLLSARTASTWLSHDSSRMTLSNKSASTGYSPYASQTELLKVASGTTLSYQSSVAKLSTVSKDEAPVEAPSHETLETYELPLLTRRAFGVETVVVSSAGKVFGSPGCWNGGLGRQVGEVHVAHAGPVLEAPRNRLPVLSGKGSHASEGAARRRPLHDAKV